MFWQRLGWPESKPAVKKFWVIRTKFGDDHSFQGRQLYMYGPLLASESQFRWFDGAINEELGRNRKPKILPWKKWPLKLVRIVQNVFTPGFDSGQPSRCQNIFQLNF